MASCKIIGLGVLLVLGFSTVIVSSKGNATFNISFSTKGLQMPVGASDSIYVTITSVGGYAGSVTLATNVAGPGLNASINPTSVNLSSGGSARATLSIGPVPSSVPSDGEFYVNVNGFGTGTSNSNYVLVVPGPMVPDFNVVCCFSTGDGSVLVSQGSTYSSWGWVNSLNNFSGTVNLALNLALPSSVSPTSLPLTPGASFEPKVLITALSSTPAGTYYGNITGQCGSTTHLAALIVQVTGPPPDYSVSTTVSSISVPQGQSASLVVLVSSLYGFSTYASCPNYWGVLIPNASTTPSATSGPSSSLNPSCLTLSAGGTNSTTLTVSTNTGTPLGSYSVSVSVCYQVSPSGWTMCHATAVTIIVLDPPSSGGGGGTPPREA
jgi:hypothetical protein